jgi:hypothetical protein
MRSIPHKWKYVQEWLAFAEGRWWRIAGHNLGTALRSLRKQFSSRELILPLVVDVICDEDSLRIVENRGRRPTDLDERAREILASIQGRKSPMKNKTSKNKKERRKKKKKTFPP